MQEYGKRNPAHGLDRIGLKTSGAVRYNLSEAALYEEALRRGVPRVVETWHPGNLAYARARSAAIAARMEPRLRESAARIAGEILVQPLLASEHSLRARRHEPGPLELTLWFLAVGLEAADAQAMQPARDLAAGGGRGAARVVGAEGERGGREVRRRVGVGDGAAHRLLVEHVKGEALLLEAERRREPRGAGADHDDVGDVFGRVFELRPEVTRDLLDLELPDMSGMELPPLGPGLPP